MACPRSAAASVHICWLMAFAVIPTNYVRASLFVVPPSQSNLTGLELSRSKLFFFKHNDMEDCEVRGVLEDRSCRNILA